MDKIELTRAQVQLVLGLSFPTALRYAQKHGRQAKNGFWYVPYYVIEAEVKKRERNPT